MDKTFEYEFPRLAKVGELIKRSMQSHREYHQHKKKYFEACDAVRYYNEQLTNLGIHDSDSDDTSDEEDVFNDTEDHQYEETIQQMLSEYENDLYRVIVDLAIKKTQP